MTEPIFTTRLARSAEDRRAGYRLRYDVFVSEMGATGPLVDHEGRLEVDAYDEVADQLLLLDETRAEDDRVIGVYRLMDNVAAAQVGRFYSEGEYDLSVLKRSGRPLMELGRSCLHTDYRGGQAMLHMWRGLGELIAARGVEILFGVASFPGTDVGALAGPLSFLAQRHLAPEPLRVRSHAYQPMDLLEESDIDRVAAMRQTPALIKAYLRLGGVVGDGAFVDHAFNTTDVCLIVDVAAMNPRQRSIYEGHT